MSSILDIVLFVGIIALLYVLLLSRFGIWTRRVRQRQARHDAAVRAIEELGKSQQDQAASEDGRRPASPRRNVDR